VLDNDDTYKFAKEQIESMVNETNDELDKNPKNKNVPRVKLSDVFVHISKAEDIPKLEDFDKTIQNLIICDDMVTNKAVNDKIKNLAIQNRHINASILYVSQSYFHIPILVRRCMGSGYCCLWNVPSGTELSTYCRELSLGVDPEEFKKLYRLATSVRYRPLIIDFKTQDPKWRFRAGLDLPIGPQTDTAMTPKADPNKISKTIKKRPVVEKADKV